jgi:iron complex outermembrane receptor protein
MMMGGGPALQFSNTDAELWGIDVAFALQLSDRLTLDSIASYTRGRRKDMSDDLYRLAPLNGSIGLSYANESWLIDARVVAYDSQKNVASFNDEQTSCGYEVVNAGVAWIAMPSLRLEARVENLLDRAYQDHLGGINRAGGSDIAVGTRLYGAERTLAAGVIVSF